MKKLILAAGLLFIMVFGFTSCIVHHHGYHREHGSGWHEFGPKDR